MRLAVAGNSFFALPMQSRPEKIPVPFGVFEKPLYYPTKRENKIKISEISVHSAFCWFVGIKEKNIRRSIGKNFSSPWREIAGRKGILIFFYITTLVSAGMIPTFIIKTKLGLFDTFWAVVLAGALGVQHVIILKTAFSQTVPSELYDAAAIDGANHWQILCSIALPLTKSTLAVLALYSAVGCWNEYFNSMIYLRNEDLYPLQLFLRNILTAAESIDTNGISSSAMLQQAAEGTKQVQYALIVVSTVPLVALYFLAQKSFKKGIMVGSIKG